MPALIDRARQHSERIAIRSGGKAYTYQTLLQDAAQVAYTLLEGKPDLEEARVAFLVEPGYDYVRLQWGIWLAGGIAVPLCTRHPLPSIRYVIEDTQASTLICSPEFEDLLAPFREAALWFLRLSEMEAGESALPAISPERRAMILYTSGTTGSPKGVVTTHQNLEAQVQSLVSSWAWSREDHILNILPLHHVHGIINILSCALWSGACCEFLPRFEAEAVFERFLEGRINLFMAVPTIYYKLIAHYEKMPPEQRASLSAVLRKFRLMVSGSAALPISVLEQWREISGHTLLERYGMTEMGMAISNPYVGERRPGHIGKPLAGVQVRIADENNQPLQDGQSGEIQVKGPNVFQEYWQKPEATQATFTPDGWLKTGDIALVDQGYYRILGRNSVDIIKSGGYKISALEIEEVLRTHPQIKDCGVVGIPDAEWGEIIAASLILADPEKSLSLDELRLWLKNKLPAYQMPRKYLIQEDLPRNVMGKVTKKALVELFS
ncbi:MAG: acyl-CoA synthetase [Bacteroidota bacterium]